MTSPTSAKRTTDEPAGARLAGTFVVAAAAEEVGVVDGMGAGSEEQDTRIPESRPSRARR